MMVVIEMSMAVAGMVAAVGMGVAVAGGRGVAAAVAAAAAAAAAVAAVAAAAGAAAGAAAAAAAVVVVVAVVVRLYRAAVVPANHRPNTRQFIRRFVFWFVQVFPIQVQSRKENGGGLGAEKKGFPWIFFWTGTFFFFRLNLDWRTLDP